MTAAGSAPSPQNPEAEPITPAIYSAFISQIELSSIWLHSSSMDNSGGPGDHGETSIEVVVGARWESAEDGFVAFHAYDVTMKADDFKVANISVTFGLEFKSEQAMSEELFTVFQDVNLPVNTWPLPEIISSRRTGANGMAATDAPSVQDWHPIPAMMEEKPLGKEFGQERAHCRQNLSSFEKPRPIISGLRSQFCSRPRQPRVEPHPEPGQAPRPPGKHTPKHHQGHQQGQPGRHQTARTRAGATEGTLQRIPGIYRGKGRDWSQSEDNPNASR